MDTKTNSLVGSFMINNAKTIITFVVFVCSLYIQYQANMIKLNQMEQEIATIKVQVEDQYAKLDNMKLDKAVFEANMRQFADMSADIRQIRDRLEDILGDHQRHNPLLNK